MQKPLTLPEIKVSYHPSITSNPNIVWSLVGYAISPIEEQYYSFADEGLI